MIFALLACATDALGPSFLTLRGAVDPSIEVDGTDARAAILWLTAVDGELCVESSTPRFVPQLLAYELHVDGPPALAADLCVPQPPDLVPAGPAAFGVVLLLDPDTGGGGEVTADPSRLLEWFSMGEPPLEEAVSVRNATLVASAQRFALMVDGTEGAASFGAPYCRFDRMVAGLTLYRDRSVDCGGWQAAAAVGVRTEFQGVDLIAIP